MCRARCRHAVAAVGSYVFSYGGLRGSTLLEDFLLSDDNSGAEMTICDPRSDPWCVLRSPSHSSLLAHVTSRPLMLSFLLHMPQIRLGLRHAESTTKVQILGKSWAMCRKHRAGRGGLHHGNGILTAM